MAPRIDVYFVHYFVSQIRFWRFLGQEFSLEPEFRSRPPFWDVTTTRGSGKKLLCPGRVRIESAFVTNIHFFPLSVSILASKWQKWVISRTFPSFLLLQVISAQPSFFAKARKAYGSCRYCSVIYKRVGKCSVTANFEPCVPREPIRMFQPLFHPAALRKLVSARREWFTAF